MQHKNEKSDLNQNELIRLPNNLTRDMQEAQLLLG
jgi:hypothetical protein